MSIAGDAIRDLLTVLGEERRAIRSLDGAAVVRAAAAKEELAGTLSGLAPSELADHAADLVKLRAELRRNGVLLAHARSCLRDAAAFLTDAKGPVIIEKRV